MVTKAIKGQNGQYSTTTLAFPSRHEQDNDVRIIQEAPRDTFRDDTLFLSRASILLTESLDEADIREHAVRLPLPHLADWCALHLVSPDGDSTSAPVIVCAHSNPDLEPRARTRWRQTVQSTPRTIPSLSSARRASERIFPPTVVDVVPEPADNYSTNTLAARLLARVGLATALYINLVSDARTIGILTLGSMTPGRYGSREIALAVAYANRVAGVLDRAQKYRKAIEMLRARDVAVTEIAHDLKTPAAQLAQYAADLHHRLAQSQVDTSDAHALRDCVQIEFTARSLLGTLDDLTANPLRDGDAEAALWKQKTDLVALVRQMVDNYTHLAAGYTLHFDADNLDQIIGYWNPGALRRILDNLLSNAITFSRPNDMITVRVWRGLARAEPGAPRREWAYLQVRDQGMGVPACDLPHVFEPFYRGGNARKLARGIGIGLTSVRNLVQRHGGTVRMASDQGEGACLTVMLPIGSAPDTAQSSRRADRREGTSRRAHRLSDVPD